MNDFLNSFNFVTPNTSSGQNGRKKVNGLSVRIHDSGSRVKGKSRKATVVMLSGEVLKNAGLSIGDSAIVGFKKDNDFKHVFVRAAKAGEKGYKISGSNSSSTGHLKMTCRDGMEDFGTMEVEFKNVEYKFGGVLALGLC